MKRKTKTKKERKKRRGQNWQRALGIKNFPCILYINLRI